MLKIRDLGEKRLLEWLQSFCPPEIIGDDGALIRLAQNQDLVITTDVLVDNVHFSEQTTSAFDVGWRAVTANLSDLAAMGASPLGITVGLSLPPELALDWLEKLYQGMSACLNGVGIIGGDLTSSSVITIGITAIGQVKHERAIKRSNAEVGDLIVVTGWHGLSRAGLFLLLNRAAGERLDPVTRDTLIMAHQRPVPRLDVVEIIKNIAGVERVAGMDSSDGLADAIIGICNCSRVGARIESLCLAPQLRDWLSSAQALDWTLYGGEDFQLVLTLAEPFAQLLVSHLGYPAAIIGRITAEETIVLVDSEGTHPLTLAKGFQHF